MAVIGVEASHLATVGAELGEGPVWVGRDQALWFVDIKAPCVHRFRPGEKRLDSWPAPGQVGWVLPSANGDFLAGLADGVHRFDPAHGRFDPYRTVEADLAGNRLNDATTDPSGRIWFGSMDNDEVNPSGRFYRLADGLVHDAGLPPVTITNGPAVSPDGETLYTVDTLGRTIDCYSIGADGAVTGKRRFLSVDPALGYPDGISTDAEGGLWVGFFGGWAARRYAADGAVTHEVRFPVANITKIALGGPDGRNAFHFISFSATSRPQSRSSRRA